jgi:hypothetical protein
MSWIISTKQYIPAIIGEAFGGGYFAGYISHTADGSPTHALIVAPRATGATGENLFESYPQTTNLPWAVNATAPDGVNYAGTLLGGSFTGSITGTTMTISSAPSGKIHPGLTITGTSVALGTIIVSQVSGTTNGAGDYTVSISQTVTSRSLTAGTSDFDGVANGTIFKSIDNTVGSGSTIFPAANFCESCTIGGFTDWYLPARFEMDIAYFNLKPSTGGNDTTQGSNIYSVPRRNSNYTLSFPSQTNLTAFNTTAEAFTSGAADWHWTSVQGGSAGATIFGTGSGFQSANFFRTNSYRVRAFRRIALPQL